MAAMCHHTASMVKISVRLPDDVHAEVVKAAEKARRSLNSEIVHRLEMSLTWEEEFFRRQEDKKKKKR
jgi:hypothetical protein